MNSDDKHQSAGSEETSTDCKNDPCEALRATHQTMLSALRTREADILKFVGFLVAGLGVFFYTLYGYMGPGTSYTIPHDAGAKLLLIGSGFAVLILTIGNVYASALGYSFRSILLYICKMEQGLQIEECRPKKWPSYSKRPKDALFPPELIGVYWWSFLVLVFAICITTCLLLWSCPNVNVMVVILPPISDKSRLS